MNILIKKATKDDVESIVNNRMDFMYQIKGEQQPDEFRKLTRDYLYEHIGGSSLLCYIAVHNGQIVSSVIVCIYYVIPKPSNITGKIGYVFNVYTIREFRGQGLATRLMKNVIAEAEQLGVGELYLSATDEGASIYKKLNFGYEAREMRLKLV